jgi:hypothetical protein
VPGAALAGDLSKYRDFQLGSDLPTVAKQAGVSPSQAKAIQSRPALIQELLWRAQPLGLASRPEAVQQVIFSFYNGELFRIAVNYDRFETEALTPEDVVGSISGMYGMSSQPPARPNSDAGKYDDAPQVLAQWQDSLYRFDLLRVYGPGYKLLGVLKRLEGAAEASIAEAARLDEKEAPQRNAERIARESEEERVSMEKKRLANKAKFRP